MEKKKAYILDTNIILQDVNNVIRLGADKDNLIVVTETVLLEIEAFKKDFTEASYNAREFSRLINNMSIAENKDIKSDENCKVVIKENSNVKIAILLKPTYLADKKYKDIKELNDKKIIEAAKCFNELNRENYSIKLITLDCLFRVFCELEDLEYEKLHDDKDESIKLNSFITIDTYSFINKRIDITEINSEHTKENFNYELNHNGNKCYGIISNGFFEPLDTKILGQFYVEPVNIRQKLLSFAIASDNFDVITVDAKAGSGKTLIALVSSFYLVDKSEMYDSIIYIRNSIESIDKGADVGYLPGLAEKFAIYNHPLYDTIKFISKKIFQKKIAQSQATTVSKDEIDKKSSELISKYDIQTMWVGEMRGRTISNSIVILDEWQNSSISTTQMVLSRLDDTCKAIIIGSNNQIDNMYLNKYNNGLTKMLKETTSEDSLRTYSIELQKAVRGKFAEFSETKLNNK